MDGNSREYNNADALNTFTILLSAVGGITNTNVKGTFLLRDMHNSEVDASLNLSLKFDNKTDEAVDLGEFTLKDIFKHASDASILDRLVSKVKGDQ